MDTLTKAGEFFLGQVFDIQQGKALDKKLIYEADDLTTHAVVVGMTGSGKTGLCIGLLEEAALDHIPALMIDPKGDLTNLLLHFPELRPEDFQPWVNPDLARREGQTLAELGQAEADKWRKGLAGSGIDRERLLALSQSVKFAIYTPGSDAGLPISILASLQAPIIPWAENREILREKISGTVTALLGLVGLQDIDPVRSREHILLSNIFENAWKAGKDLDLGELILQTQTPPFEKLGVFDINTFYPARDRFELAMLLNNILASPSFQSWIEGQPLDVASLLYTPDGKPRHSVFYIAHLTDVERMFFVTLLFSAVESWMRTQTGTPSLRSLVYFDEIFGYLPPVANPPSKPVMLRMLKQARAFGVGLVLATQNPADVDYKGLSNTGTWLIGKLQTEQDKRRLLDGLEGAVPGSFNRNDYDKLISGLGKRVFLLHNVHAKGPVVMTTRWAMNYLAGPLTRTQVPDLNRLVGEDVEPAPVPGLQATTAASSMAARPTAKKPSTTSAASTAATASAAAGTASQKTKPGETQSSLTTTTRPALPQGVDEYFLPVNLTFSNAFKAAGQPFPEQAQNLGLVYQPVLIAQAGVRFLNRTYDLDFEMKHAALVSKPDRRGMVRWEDFIVEPLVDEFEAEPVSQARYKMLENPLSEARLLTAMRKDFQDWVFQKSEVKIRVNEPLEIYAGPDISQAEFRTRCSEAARKLLDAEVKKVEAAFKKRVDAVQDKIDREERELNSDEAVLDDRKMEEWGTHAENLISLFGGRKRRLTTSLSKRRQTAQAKANVQESKETIKDYEEQIKQMEADKAQALQELQDHYAELVNTDSEMTLSPMKKDVLVEAYGIAWFPYYRVQTFEGERELPGYQQKA
jgi:hypothetical protein